MGCVSQLKHNALEIADWYGHKGLVQQLTKVYADDNNQDEAKVDVDTTATGTDTAAASAPAPAPGAAAAAAAAASTTDGDVSMGADTGPSSNQSAT